MSHGVRARGEVSFGSAVSWSGAVVVAALLGVGSAHADAAPASVRVQVVGCEGQPLDAIRRIASIELRHPVEMSADPGRVRLECEEGLLRVVVGDDARELSTIDADAAVLSRLVALSIVESLRAVELEATAPIRDAEVEPTTPEPTSADEPVDGEESSALEPPVIAEPWGSGWSIAAAGGVRVYPSSEVVLGGALLGVRFRTGLLSLGLAASFHRTEQSVPLGRVEIDLIGGMAHVGLAGDVGPIELLADLGLSVEAAHMAGSADDSELVQASSGWAALISAQLMAEGRWHLATPLFLSLRVGAEVPLAPVSAGVDGVGAARLEVVALWAGAGFGLKL